MAIPRMTTSGYDSGRGLPVGRIIGLGLGAIAILFGITIVFASWYTIDQGERGVILRNGKLIGTAEPGLGFKWPWVDSVVRVSTQSHIIKYCAALGDNPHLVALVQAEKWNGVLPVTMLPGGAVPMISLGK